MQHIVAEVKIREFISLSIFCAYDQLLHVLGEETTLLNVFEKVKANDQTSKLREKEGEVEKDL